MKKSPFAKVLLLPLLLVFPALTGCTNSQGESEAVVSLTASVASGGNPLTVNIADPVPLQLTQIDVASHFKNPNATDPQHFADVNITSYVASYKRIDGGTKVPAPETFGGFLLVPSGGTASIINPPIMYGYALQQSPFDQLLPFNGGIDQETGRSEITLIASIVFYGETVSGQRVQSTPATTESLIFQYVP
jgi:hypothetical protein